MRWTGIQNEGGRDTKWGEQGYKMREAGIQNEGGGRDTRRLLMFVAVPFCYGLQNHHR